MSRRSYRYDPETKQMYEVAPSGNIPQGLLEDNFKSPVDGSIITSQRKLHEHNARNGVRQVSPEIEHGWNEARKERDDFYTGKSGKQERIETIKNVIDTLERR